VKGVEIYVADLDALPPDREDWSILAPDEVERAQRFRFDRHRTRFVRCRVLLRQLIAKAIEIDAASIAFRYGAYGKPELDAIHFNVSHSGPMAAVALTHEGPIGIDVETIDRKREVVALARTAFSPDERAAIALLSHEEQIDAFFRGWTRKEAYMKLLGTGFSMPPDSFTVSLNAEPLSTIGEFVLRDLVIAEGYACAMAMRGGDTPLIRLRHLLPSRGEKEERGQ
jgi:4'-phosphopantetheinyl transferase